MKSPDMSRGARLAAHAAVSTSLALRGDRGLGELADEADFFDQHRTYDRCYAVTHLVKWLAFALHGHTPEGST